jgi:hypothetical protein
MVVKDIGMSIYFGGTDLGILRMTTNKELMSYSSKEDEVKLSSKELMDIATGMSEETLRGI